MGLKAHQKPGKGDSDVWLTPKWLMDRLPRFDLDPCAAPSPQPWPTAKTMIVEDEDGFTKPWAGRVWLNPPFSAKWKWMAKLAEHGDGIGLLAAATETKEFRRYVWDRADGLLFLYGRPYFCRPDGTPGHSNSGAPIVLVAYGERNARALYGLEDLGAFTALSSDDKQGDE
jgi:hypothetical protein